MQQTARPPALVGCDTVVALGSSARRGVTLFGKNSDRPPGEPQAPLLVERALHAPGERVRCQYVEVAQVRETARVLGSRPTWLWGFEMGLNEHGVAIGNETVFTHEAPAAIGLIGMDLVRLGLERAASAEASVEALIELIETHGQGGSGFRDLDWPYNNSFLIADPERAWILEAAGRQWATRRCDATDSISNQLSIAADWDRLGDGVVGRARALGLDASEPFDFARAYRDTASVPRALSEGRLRRSRALLRDGHGGHSVASLQSVLRDHDATGARFVAGAAPDQEQFYTVCMHQGPSRTAASLVAELERGRRPSRVAWLALGRPCTSLYLPVLLEGALPPSLERAGEEGDADGAGLWWVFERLAALAEASDACAELITGGFAALERDIAAEVSVVQGEIASSPSTAAAARATAANAAAAARVDGLARDLLGRCTCLAG